MKKLFVVSKTHLDLGFTNYAAEIKKKYIDSFIPGAVELARTMNTPEKKSFVWTTGSWILKEALRNGAPAQQAELRAAIERGDIVPHAMPFTTHTELLDEDTLDYGLSIVDELDALRGRKTVAAKMTDVPGHTIGLVKALHRHGIKLLHIGVNGASALPEVPECFVWRDGEAEIVVVYSGDYGGAYKSDLVEEILYFDHTLDNHGAPAPEKIQKKLASIEAQYPGYEVTAGCLDDFAEIIWEKRSELPVLENEIGDTWIHGSASDPYKSAAFRELMSLKRRWLADGSMEKGSEEYKAFTDSILCVAEHTCGMDMKVYFADYENYLKKDFQKARKADTVKIRHIFRDFPQNFLTAWGRKFGNNKPGSYKVIEKSWAEQRLYIEDSVSTLSPEHRTEAEKALAALRPVKPIEFAESKEAFSEIECGEWLFELNEKGGIGSLSYCDDEFIRENNEPVFEYHSYACEDYDFWLNNYARNLKQTFGWAVGDFARPLLKYVKGKYPTGRFTYSVKKAGVSKENPAEPKIYVDLVCDAKLCEQLGAPRLVQLVYTLKETGVTLDVSWFEKDASRLTEAMFLRLFPAKGDLKLHKISADIAPLAVASKGGRNLHAVSYAELATSRTDKYRIINHHAPLFAQGRGKILEFDNRFEDIEKDGFSYLLYDNVWGTNFPLWYEENAAFRFEIKAADETEAK